MSFSPDSEYPCLLDRIVGSGDAKSARRRTMTFADYRAAVLRDLKWLMNSPQYPDPVRCLTWVPSEMGSLHEREDHLRTEDNRQGHCYPFVRKSVLNYGTRSLAGKVVHGMDIVELERELREAIITFEPRFIPHSVSVKRVEEDDRTTHPAGQESPPGKLAFEVKAQLWALPHSEPVCFRSAYDLETGDCVINDLS